MNENTQIILLILQAVSVVCFFLATITIKGFKDALTKVQESISDLNKHIIQLLERDKSKDAQIDAIRESIKILFSETKQLRERYHDRVNEDANRIQKLEVEFEQFKRGNK